MKIYLLPGMGADHRLFGRLDPGAHRFCPVSWVKPGPGDSLGGYARKLLPQLSDSGHSVLLGVSMGGMLAVELNKLTPFKKVVLVSSAKVTAELPPYFRRLAKAGWHKKIGAPALLRLRRLAGPLMDYFGSGYRVSSEMLKDTDPAFLDWCLEAVLSWRNETVPPNLVHIHGTADLLLPARYISGYIPVKRGSHLMIYQRAAEINNLLRQITTGYEDTARHDIKDTI